MPLGGWRRSWHAIHVVPRHRGVAEHPVRGDDQQRRPDNRERDEQQRRGGNHNRCGRPPDLSGNRALHGTSNIQMSMFLAFASSEQHAQ